MEARLKSLGIEKSVKVHLKCLSYGKGNDCPLEYMRCITNRRDVNAIAKAFDDTELDTMFNLPRHHEMRYFSLFYTAPHSTDTEKIAMRRVEQQLEEALKKPLW